MMKSNSLILAHYQLHLSIAVMKSSILNNNTAPANLLGRVVRVYPMADKLSVDNCDDEVKFSNIGSLSTPFVNCSYEVIDFKQQYGAGQFTGACRPCLSYGGQTEC